MIHNRGSGQANLDIGLSQPQAQIIILMEQEDVTIEPADLFEMLAAD